MGKEAEGIHRLWCTPAYSPREAHLLFSQYKGCCPKLAWADFNSHNIAIPSWDRRHPGRVWPWARLLTSSEVILKGVVCKLRMTEQNGGQLSEQLWEEVLQWRGIWVVPTHPPYPWDWPLGFWNHLCILFSPFPNIYKLCTSMRIIKTFQNDISFVCMCIYDASVRVCMTAKLHIWKS